MLFKSFCVRGYFHSLLYRSLRVPATFLVSFSVVTLQAIWLAYSNWVFAFWLSYRCHWADFCFLCFFCCFFFFLLFCFVFFFCQLFAQRRTIRRKLKHMQTCTLSFLASCCTSSVLTGSFKLGSVKLNKGTVVTRLTVFNFLLSSLRANENNQKRTETQTWTLNRIEYSLLDILSS